MRVSVSGDATVITGRIQYDPVTNQLVGFSPALNENGVPVINGFLANTAKEILQHFQSGHVSRNIYLIMAQPLAVNASPFCLAVYATDNKYSSDDVSRQWKWIYDEGMKEGIIVTCQSTDGDPKCLKAMLAHQLSSTPSAKWPWFNAETTKPKFICLQDIIHLIVKLKSKLLKPSVILPFGNKLFASRGHIVELIETCSKDLHGLSMSFVNVKDKMNYRAAEKLIDAEVSSLLRKSVPNSEATATYLDMMRCTMSAFLDPKLSPLDRIEQSWVWVFFARIWRKYVTYKDGYTLSNNFITSNAYSCMELNAHSLVLVTQMLRDSEEHELFLTWLMTSQPCEESFRSLRGLSPIKSSVITFSELAV